MKLSLAQRNRLLAGGYSPLVFPVKPHGCEPGCRYVLNWRGEVRTHDGNGKVVVGEREPLRWVEVTSVVRRTKGDWLVRFDVFDLRDPDRFLRASPPRHDASTAELKAEGDSASAEESFYTTSPAGAVDHLQVVPRGYTAPDAATLYQKQKRLLEAEQRTRLSLGGQLDSLLEDARCSRVDVHSRARRIRREIDLLARDLQDRSAA